ncbi:universal stress protein [Embleya scabrispora]|uniref:universal stress protein n=1 Tax=Embleya scabrispora TaxID=159449 RepID=UPI00036DDFA9|nr:universal stress protein [Embleya scabrispora]MYS79963.1 universal stress protein [Streptomyces sp. SID5474]
MADTEPKGVVVGVDGSEPARRALGWAMTEAELRGLPLYVVTAQPATPGYAVLAPGPHYQEDLERVLAELRIRTETMVTEVNGERERPFGGHAVVQVYSGTATEVLLGMSERHEMVVVGSRGSGGFSRLLLGSVSTAVVHHAACPVLVVRG